MIYDPASPPLIFDGKLDVFSTCRDCGKLMKVITADQHSHPTCAKVQTQLEGMADLLASELRAENWEQAELTEKLMAEVSVLDIGSAALQYADWGWPVFPLARHGKTPAIPKAKGGKGFHDANTDRKRIDRYWSRHPDHNIGLATGWAFDVIDIDTKDSKGNPDPKGVQSFTEALHETVDGMPVLPDIHGVAVTASGGMHLYVRPTGRGNFAGIGKDPDDGILLYPGIDYRGVGGYVVAPPSTLGKPGRDYTWLVEPSPIIREDF